MRFRLCTLLAATAAGCALIPAAAHAATLTLEGNTIVYRGEGSEGLSLLLTSMEDNGTKYLNFYDSGADRQSFDSSICHTSQYSSGALCVLDPNRPIRIEGSEAKDSIAIFSASDVPDSIPITVDGKGGDDQIKDAYDSSTGRTFYGGAGNDKIEGYGGNDVIDGGDGNDEVDGGEGNDEVHAGAGDDVLFGDHYKSPGADVLDGGPGFDQVDEWSIPDAPVHPLASVSLNDAADDGRPGEGDNVQSIEKFTFHVNSTFTGSDSAESVEVLNVSEGSSNLDGGGGSDVLKAWDSNDTVNGGPGNDQVEGGLGNDVVTGGPGKDMIMGDATASRCTYYSCTIAFGNDTIYAQDGEADQIDCGIGDDVAYVDPIDTATNCETVKSDSPSRAGTPNPGGSVTSGPGTPGGTKAALALTGTATLKNLLARRLGVGVPCPAACRVSVTAKAGGRTVATGKATLLAAGTAKVRLKVAAKARRSVRRARKLKVTLTATVTGAEGRPQRLTRSVTLKK